MNWIIVSGTNREDSQTRLVSDFLLSEFQQRRPDDSLAVLDLKELPNEAFSPQIYANKPRSVEAFIQKFIDADAVISVLPEYNGSAPGVFKYFIDLLPFPESLLKTPCMFVGLSAGRFGAVRSIEHMSQVFVYRNAFVYPEHLYFPQVQDKFKDGKLIDEFSLKLKDPVLDGFVEFATQNSTTTRA